MTAAFPCSHPITHPPILGASPNHYLTMKTLKYAGALLAVLSFGRVSVSAQTSNTYLLDFGGNGAAVYQSSDTVDGDINYMDGTQNGSGFNVNQIVAVTSPTFGGGSGALGDTFAIGSYTLTMTSAYGTYNIGGSATNNTGVYDSFFLTSGQTPVTFSISGLSSTDTVSISFLSSQAWAVQMTASTTSDFSSNTITASSSGTVTNTTEFTQLGSLTGNSTLYFSFVAAAGSGNEGDLSGMIINVTSASAIPEPSTCAAILGVASLGLVALRRRRKG